MVDFRRPDYKPVWEERRKRLVKLRSKPELVGPLLEFYKDNPVKFISDWGCTFDPRNAEIGLETTVPFIMFPKQEQFVEWCVDRWRCREDGLAEKSRDMGVSWLCVAVAVWMWRFHPGTVIGFGSRKEEYVDKIGDPKSLFWKARQFIALLPKEFRPAGYTEKTHAPHMRILNPENGAAIVGEAGDNIGRGNRTSIYFKDESAFYEHPDAIDAALSQTSNCKIDVSTPNGNGNPFFRKRHSGKVKVFTFHWRDDPRKDEQWYQKQRESLDPVILAQEVDIDYNASVGDAWIDGDSVSAAQLLGPKDVEANGGWSIGIDAAHYGDDESVITLRRGRLTLPQIVLRGADGIQLAARVEDECHKLSQIGQVIWGITIELDGPGVSCFDQLRGGRLARVVNGIHTGGKKADPRDFNLRASLWRKAKDYLAEGGCSMPRDPELKSQLCSVKYKYKDGLLIMQSKKEYKSIYQKSPDRADSFILTFAVEAPRMYEEDFDEQGFAYDEDMA